MSRIVVASASEAGREKLSGLLASSGYNVFRVCASGGELRRAIGDCEDGVVLLWGIPPDCRPDELAWDYRGLAQVLLIARPEALAACESQELFTLSLPCPASQVIGAVEMLTQLHRMRLPKRTGDDRALVDRAKRRLMRERGMTEPEAHRAMQQYAMQHGIKMTEYAEQLLNSHN